MYYLLWREKYSSGYKTKQNKTKKQPYRCYSNNGIQIVNISKTRIHLGNSEILRQLISHISAYNNFYNEGRVREAERETEEAKERKKQKSKDRACPKLQTCLRKKRGRKRKMDRQETEKKEKRGRMGQREWTRRQTDREI